mmetsp:Transcript_27642/g.63359  ORF Transcript_27642/g.63359 Transcript_27642/m.63359 type:complete len:225 (+) Transcript_27642:604-1278(+)
MGPRPPLLPPPHARLDRLPLRPVVAWPRHRPVPPSRPPPRDRRRQRGPPLRRAEPLAASGGAGGGPKGARGGDRAGGFSDDGAGGVGLRGVFHGGELRAQRRGPGEDAVSGVRSASSGGAGVSGAAVGLSGPELRDGSGDLEGDADGRGEVRAGFRNIGGEKFAQSGVFCSQATPGEAFFGRKDREENKAGEGRAVLDARGANAEEKKVSKRFCSDFEQGKIST